MEVLTTQYDRFPVMVLSCLWNGEITVILFPGNGFVDGGLLEKFPVEMIPFDWIITNTQILHLIREKSK